MIVWMQTEIDFGPTPVSEMSFLIAHQSHWKSLTPAVVTQLSYTAPTGKDLDELEMDDLIFRASILGDNVLLYVKSSDGSYLHDKFKVNFLFFDCYLHGGEMG